MAILSVVKKSNYLNNKDILKEIHKSKSSYCSFSKPELSRYDIILDSVNDIPGAIEHAKIVKATLLTKAIVDASTAYGTKVKADTVAVDAASIKTEDLVFRVMTWDHIPVAIVTPKKQSKVASDMSELFDAVDEPELAELDDEILSIEVPKLTNKRAFVKVNFPPFQHFQIDPITMLPICVGKSHWQGDLDTGQFCRTHGNITHTISLMYMKLCERYASRSNWRGYSYIDEMILQAQLQLVQSGLQFNEGKSDNPFAYFSRILENSFTRVLNIEKRNQNIRDDLLQINNMNPSYTRMNNSSNNLGSGADE